MSKPTKGTGNVHRLHDYKAIKVEPLDGWTVQTKYGTLRLPVGVNCVRLADVHAWMARDGKPSDMVVSEMFEPLLRAAVGVCSGYTPEEAESIRIVSALHLVKATGYPVPLFEPAISCKWDEDPGKCENMHTYTCRSVFPKSRMYVEANVERYVPQITFAGGLDIKTLRAAFPDQGNYVCEDGTVAGLVYALSVGAKRVLTAGVDLQTDVVAARRQKNEVEDEAHHGIKWPRHEIVRSFLDRLVVPISVAHELWAWGRVVADQVEAAAASDNLENVQAGGKTDCYDWKGKPELYAMLERDFGAAKGATVKARREAVAAAWGLSPSMVKKALREGKKTASAGKPKKASPFHW